MSIELRTHFESFASEIERELSSMIEAQGERFPSRATLLERFRDSAAGLLDGEDPFQNRQQHFMSENGIVLARNIDQFVFVRRPGRLVRPDRVGWRVQPPVLPV